MEVLGSDGQHVGTVDHLEGTDKIKLTKSDPQVGRPASHHPAQLGRPRWTPSVHLNKPAKDAMTQWQAAA